MFISTDILLAALVSALLLLAGHWFNWRLVFGGLMPRLWAYIYGVLAIMLPLLGLLAVWREWRAMAAATVISVASGSAVVLAYLVDAALLRTVERREEQERRNKDA